MFNRFNGNVVPFASDATGTNRTIFGDITQSDNIDDNLNGDFKLGWEIVGINDNPTKQDFNALAFTISNLVAYLYQQGLATWNTAQEYFVGSYAIGSDYKLYVSNTGTSGTPNIGNNPTTDTINWSLFTNFVGTSVDNTIPKFDGTKGKLQSSSIIIDDDNNLGIGETPETDLHISRSETTVYNGSATDGQLAAGSSILIEQRGGSNIAVAQIVFQPRSGQPYCRIVSSGGSTPFLAFITNNVERMRIESDGAVTINSQGIIGIDQSWQDLTASRSLGVTYTNTSGKPISVSVNGSCSTNGSSFTLTVDGQPLSRERFIGTTQDYVNVEQIIPVGSTYSVTGGSGVSIIDWYELRD